MGFTKLDSGIVDSSIWGEDAETCKVWITLLALSNSCGDVRGSIGWLAWKSKVPAAKCAFAIAKFIAPDPASRNPENDGRRLEETDRGWHLLNYEEYRDFSYSENPSAVRMRRMRASHSVTGDVVTNISEHSASASDTGKVGGCKGEGKPKASSPVIPLLLQTPAFLEAWERWLDHLRQKHKPPTTHATDLQLKKCESWGEKRAITALNYSIEKNWQGIYEEHTNGQNRSQPRSRFADRNKGTLNEGQGHVYAEFMERQNAAPKT
jgi:hypothetical protein